MFIAPRNTTEQCGFCDRTGFLCLFKDLRRQYEWRGDQLVYTGLMVHKDYLDKPDEFLKTRKIREPELIRDARPGKGDLAPLPPLPEKTRWEIIQELNRVNFQKKED